MNWLKRKASREASLGAATTSPSDFAKAAEAVAASSPGRRWQSRIGRNKKQELAAPESPAASVMSHASSAQSAMSACSSDDVQPFHDDRASTSAASEDSADTAGPSQPSAAELARRQKLLELQTLMEQLSRIEAEQQRLLMIQTGGMSPGMIGGMMMGAGPGGAAMMPGAAPGERYVRVRDFGAHDSSDSDSESDEDEAPDFTKPPPKPRELLVSGGLTGFSVAPDLKARDYSAKVDEEDQDVYVSKALAWYR